ncbi:RluA family pseudouridine synthase [Gorillibacterium sp. sgz500922]|uniref:RluA family pseudouridine synthase n=1 Tax=Gorillibacterium sp. sgz500922 TaxID=3446694 RepID=UPI003F66A8FC
MTEYGRRAGEWLELPAPLPPDRELASWLLEDLGFQPQELRQLAVPDAVRLKGSRVYLRLFPGEEAQYEPEWDLPEPEVLFEDDFCLVVNKPAGMPVHPVEAGARGSLGGAVAAYYAASGQAVRIRHIHRLDADTTGPVLYAKNAFAQRRLDEEMRAKAVERFYLAVVQGVPRRRKGTIDAPIGRDRHRSGYRRVSPTGEKAVTHYEVMETYHDASLIKLRLETGRTHQIRVHLAHIGHPLVGDKPYGGRPDALNRQALHGAELAFRHPFTREPVRVVAPYPAEFAALLEELRRPSV